MTKKVLVTSYMLVRELDNPDSFLGPAVNALRAEGMEFVHFGKGEHEYGMEELAAVFPGPTAAIIGAERWDEEKFRIASGLKCLIRFGVGYDAVDIAGAKKYGIMATNARTPELSYSVAECALTLTLAGLRQFIPACVDLKRGEWNARPGRQLRGKTVGIVGFGAIGRCLAELLLPFRVRVAVCDPYLDRAAAAALNAEAMEMDGLLSASDIVNLCAPNTPENRRMFNAATFGKMKRGAFFVNTARGALVDEAALYRALASGHLAGAGLDVWEREPTPPDNPLLSLDNVIPFPHMAAETAESALAVAMCCARQAIAACSGREPEYLLNP